MRSLKRLFLLLSFCFLLVPLAYSAELDFPYARLRLKFPPANEAFPGFGNNYTTIARGQKSALWNPASLGKLKLSEASFSTLLSPQIIHYTRTETFAESSDDLNFNGGGSGSSGGKYAIFLRSPDDIGPGIVTEEVNMNARANYATESQGHNFSTALKVNEWFTIGFSSKNPFEFDMDLAGDVPVTPKVQTDFRGQEFGDDMQITSDGKFEFSFDSGGSVTTYESSSAIWDGFITQEALVPIVALAEMRNNVNIDTPFMTTLASRYDKLYVGLNMIPINATANIDNDVRTVVRSDAEDVFLYTPDFDVNNEAELINWINDPNKYGTSAGYQRKQLKLPAGELIATAKYRGYYTASTTRFDLGAMYDVTDWFTVGIALENFNSSALNFKGNGIASYMSYRDINTSEVENFDDLIQPGGETSLDLFSDRWVTTFEANGTKFLLEPEKNYALPKRIRYGFALKKPILFAIDFEQNQTPITIITFENDTQKEIIISDISLIRIGLETQLFALPMWFRGGATFLPKPTIVGLTAEAQANIDEAYENLGKFMLPGAPVRLDLGSNINAWGTIVGLSLGFNAQSVLNFIQLDSTSLDMSKVVFGNFYVERDAWKVDYNAELDPIATAAAYGSRKVAANEEKEFETSDVRFIQTLGVTYRF